MGFKILGVGSYLPGTAIPNSALKLNNAIVDENWIESRTGIKQRFFAAPKEYTSHLAYQASINAIADAGISNQDIDLVVVCTTTPDNNFPSTATKLQGMLGLENAPSFDLQAVCAGFVYGLEIVASLMNNNNYQHVLLVGAERMSSLLDFSDRSTSILFGDGAGAVILRRDQDSNSGLLSSKLFSQGNLRELLYTTSGVANEIKSGFIQMRGQEVFRHAVEKMTNAIHVLLDETKTNIEDISYVIPHQANLRIIESITARLNIPAEKVIKTIDQHANCSAASIPLALNILKQTANLKTGDLILMTALGAGLTWGSALIRW